MNPEQLTGSPGAGGPPSERLARIGGTVSARLAADPTVQPIAVPGIQMFVRQDFLSAPDCAALIAMIDANSRPSTLFAQHADNDFRTSDSCDLDRWDHLVNAIDLRICSLMDIDPAHGETLQGQRYRPGQQFRTHHDFFHTDQPYWQTEAKRGGQRSWTAMIYLNEPEAGGETDFPALGIRASARTGMLLTWNNMDPDGAPNLRTVHAGLPVARGVKYIVTKWFRELPWL